MCIILLCHVVVSQEVYPIPESSVKKVDRGGYAQRLVWPCQPRLADCIACCVRIGIAAASAWHCS